MHIKKTAKTNKKKTKKITNLGQSISVIYFKAKINFKDAPTSGKQTAIDYDLAKEILTKVQEYTAARANRIKKLNKF